jgi:hypothetical protein
VSEEPRSILAGTKHVRPLRELNMTWERRYGQPGKPQFGRLYWQSTHHLRKYGGAHVWEGLFNPFKEEGYAKP